MPNASNTDTDSPSPFTTQPPTLIAKFGSNTLLGDDGGVDHAFLADVSEQVRRTMAMGIRVVLVSSGAVASGRALVNDHTIDGHTQLAPEGSAPAAIPTVTNPIDRHALAAVGQAQLAFDWQAAMRRNGLRTAQVLVTEHDFIDPERCASLRRTLSQLLDHGIVPVVNENDAVSRKNGDTLADNDWLAALLAVRLRAHHMMLLTDIDGLYDADPRSNPRAKRISVLPHIDRKIVDAAGGPGAHGTGGMRGKIIAARLASAAGVPVTITRARFPDIMSRICAEEAVGTRVLAANRPKCEFNDLLRMTSQTSGRLILDSDAHHQLRGTGDISIGALRGTQGVFKQGDPVALSSRDGYELGRGLASLPAEEIDNLLRHDEARYYRVVEGKKLFLLEPRPDLALSA